MLGHRWPCMLCVCEIDWWVYARWRSALSVDKPTGHAIVCPGRHAYAGGLCCPSACCYCQTVSSGAVCIAGCWATAQQMPQGQRCSRHLIALDHTLCWGLVRVPAGLSPGAACCCHEHCMVALELQPESCLQRLYHTL
jgi:hypothetical protein